MKNTKTKNNPEKYTAHLYSLKMVKEENIEFIPTQIDSPTLTYNFIWNFYQQKGYDREVFTVIAVDNRLQVNGIHVAHIGSLTSCPASPREIFKFAILCNAKGIILAHNHPSGNLNASKADLKMTSRLSRVGLTLDMQVYDSLIIGHDGYTSILSEHPDSIHKPY